MLDGVLLLILSLQVPADRAATIVWPHSLLKLPAEKNTSNFHSQPIGHSSSVLTVWGKEGTTLDTSGGQQPISL